MKELLDKLSSYNLFNYLLPGTIFVAVASRMSEHTFKYDNIVVELFLYYFIGLIISRIGSLAVEPAMKKTKFVRFAPYKDFVRACANDPKIEILSEQNNMFRTLCALFLTLLGFKVFDFLVWRFGVSRRVTWPVVFIALFVLFALAYRKQTYYVKQRVEVASK
jgi:hypothetical protein